MVESRIRDGSRITATKHFDSMGEFQKYLAETALNEIFRWGKLSSTDYYYGFNKTKTYDEAQDLAKNGWEDMAKKLTQILKVSENQFGAKAVSRNYYDVGGFQANVPRYLQNIPTNMVNSKKVIQRAKVITIIKNISYNSGTSEQEIIDNSIKALQIVKAIEEKGIRVNLEIMFGGFVQNEGMIHKIKIKQASERTNISKLAFAMVHPDMLRRLMFRAIEVNDYIKQSDWKYGYGSPMKTYDQMKPYLKKDEYFLNSFIPDVKLEVERIQKGLK